MQLMTRFKGDKIGIFEDFLPSEAAILERLETASRAL
jgi:hypothetical protein